MHQLAKVLKSFMTVCILRRAGVYFTLIPYSTLQMFILGSTVGSIDSIHRC